MIESSISSNLAQGLYIRVGSEHSLISCGIPGGTILTPNLRAGLKESGRVFSWPEFSTWTRFNLLDNEHLYVGP